MGTAANVLVGATGKVYGAPSGTPLPTTSTMALNAAFKDIGYISDAGVIQGIARNQQSILAWGGDEVRKISTSHELTYHFVMLETNVDSLEAYYGEQDDALISAVKIKSQAGTRQAWVIDIVDGVNVVRIAIPDGEVGVVGDVTYATATAISYDVTLACYADTSGNKAYKYVIDKGVS